MKRYLPVLVTVVAAIAVACSGSPAAEEFSGTASGGPVDSGDQVVSRGECEVYGEFALGQFKMLNERSSHSAILLDDGTVLVVAGRGKGGPRGPRLFPFTEIYDPATGQWTDSVELAQAREFFALVSLAEFMAMSIWSSFSTIKPL